MACTPQELAQRSSCFFCLPPGYYYPMKLAILARWLASMIPGANTTVAGLLSDASAACIACPPGAQLGPIRLALICDATSGGGVTPDTPVNLDITDNSDDGNVILTWSQTSAPQFNEIWVSVNGGAYSLVATIAGALTTYTDTTGMSSGDLWRYRIRAKTGSNTSSFSNTVSISFNLLYDSTADVTISIPDLVRAVGNLTIINEASLTTIDLPALRTVQSVLDIESDPVLATLTLTSLASVGSFFTLRFLDIFTTLSLPALVSVGDQFDITANAAILTVNCPSLTTLGSDLLASLLTTLTSISMPLLQTVRSIDFNGDTSLTTLSFPALTTFTIGAGTVFNADSCTSLTSVNLPLVILPATFSFVLYSNDAVDAASINQILARGVASGTTNDLYLLDGGTNAAPTGQGILDKAALILAGNTVNTN